jgi:hypothetical protein
MNNPCILCKTSQTAIPLPRPLQSALLSCCHLLVPGASEPVCAQCRRFYEKHLKEHDGKNLGYKKPEVKNHQRQGNLL